MVRFAVIGRGMIAEKWIQAAQTLADFSLEAVYSRTLADAQAFAQAHGAQKAYDSLEGLAQDKEVDAVYIASPNALHAPQALRMLEAGKHVLLEKPLAVNARQAEQLFACARANKRLLLEATRTLFSPGLAQIKQLLPRLGRLRLAQFSYCQYSSKYDRFKKGEKVNTFDPALGNGGLMDLGVYCVEAAAWLFGEATRCSAANWMMPHGWDAMGTVCYGYGSPAGLQVDVRYSKISQGNAPSEIQGEDACLLIDHIAQPDRLTLIGRGQPPQDVPFIHTANDLADETRAFLDMLAGRLDPQPYQQCTCRSLRMMDLARARLGITYLQDAQPDIPSLTD